MTDPSAEVRDRALRGINAMPALWAGKASTALLLAALVDDSPALRRLGLELASTKPGFWGRSDAREYLKQLLIDPDGQVRLAALATVERQGLIRKEERALARRVKALESDPALAARAQAVLRVQGADPARVVPDVLLGRPRQLSLETFRRTVNPLFYQPGEDGHACASCHATHTILRIAEADPRSPSDEAVRINYNAALKVVNLGDPESSLILRKPRSPQGQGGPDSSSPTGLTHVGGPRWDSTDHPAYRAILAWIRSGSGQEPVVRGQ